MSAYDLKSLYVLPGVRSILGESSPFCTVSTLRLSHREVDDPKADCSMILVRSVG
jgi:hypothetical protein